MVKKEDLQTALRGVLMGSANVVPGVSGGTVALIVGIYGRLINALGAFDLKLIDLLTKGKWRRAAEHVDLRFLAALGLGAGTAIVSLAKLITWLILNKPIPTWSLFFGLILASAWHVSGFVKRWNGSALAAAAVGAAFAYWISGLLPGETAKTYTSLFLAGVVSISAMILPGISGSFILVVLGKYRMVLEAIHQFELPVLVVFGLGCAIGLIAFAKLLKFLIRRWEPETMALLCGLMAGSLRKIWPFKTEALGQELLKAKHRVHGNFLPDAFDETVAWAIAMVLVGAAIVLLAERLAGERKKV